MLTNKAFESSQPQYSVPSLWKYTYHQSSYLQTVGVTLVLSSMTNTVVTPCSGRACEQLYKYGHSASVHCAVSLLKDFSPLPSVAGLSHLLPTDVCPQQVPVHGSGRLQQGDTVTWAHTSHETLLPRPPTPQHFNTVIFNTVHTPLCYTPINPGFSSPHITCRSGTAMATWFSLPRDQT